MYYNIKIKTKGSELGLESTDRLIIEKEMDLYFSRMFDVSEEFKADIAKFKDVKIVSSNVKSISELEMLSKNNDIKPQQPQHIINSQLQNQQVQQTIQPQMQAQTHFQQPQTINQPQQVQQIQQSPISQNIQPQPSVEAQSNNYEPIKTYKEFANELDKNIQNVYNQQNNHVDINEVLGIIFDKNENHQSNFQQQVNQQQTQNIQQNANNFEQIQKQLNFEEEQRLKNMYFNRAGENNILETAQQQIIKEQTQRQSKFDEIQKHFMEQKVNFKNEKETVLQPEINPLLQKAQINPQTGIMENMAAKPQEQNIQQTVQPQIQMEQQKPQPKAQEIVNKKSEISFSSFLMGFSAIHIHDQFLVAAFYIKNILKHNSFSLKFLNSTLFQATGKIADLSIVEELIQIGYIISVDLIEVLEYTITPTGEDYLVSKLKV